MVYEIMDTDLHQIIRSPQPLSGEQSLGHRRACGLVAGGKQPRCTCKPCATTATMHLQATAACDWLAYQLSCAHMFLQRSTSNSLSTSCCCLPT